MEKNRDEDWKIKYREKYNKYILYNFNSILGLVNRIDKHFIITYICTIYKYMLVLQNSKHFIYRKKSMVFIVI